MKLGINTWYNRLICYFVGHGYIIEHWGKLKCVCCGKVINQCKGIIETTI